ncbi:hypothetical protein [Paenibacillus caui]|uniref:hypothetical protein n=1 Tax=Paenibacillus caui TaxID=2873927 RepID=UPI001CA949D7|nr:hypothetical protein [Paenibacillus caui]
MKRFAMDFSTKMLLSGALIVGSLSGTAVFAAEKTESVVSNQTVVSVHDFVPESYFATYSGKFNSVEELKKAAGYNATASKSTYDQTPGKSIKVDSIDEYAALLFYYNDLAASNANNPVEVKTYKVSAAANDYYREYSQKWNDNGLSWMYSYVVAHIVNDKIEGTPTTDSALLGFHPGNSWEHKQGLSYATVDSSKTGGYAHIVGNLTLSIIWEGVGDIVTKQLTHDWSY